MKANWSSHKTNILAGITVLVLSDLIEQIPIAALVGLMLFVMIAILSKKLVLKHLSPECQALLTKAKDLVEVNVSEDTHYHVSMNR